MQKNSQSIFILFGALILTYGCATLNTKSSQISAYSENISVLRPQFEENDDEPIDTLEVMTQNDGGTSANDDISERINQMLESNFKQNESIDFVNGYTIQVYSGSSRENADNVKADIYKYIPNARPIRGWEAPNFKVRVGEFLEKIEAQKIYVEIKTHFPQAIIIPFRIPNSDFSNK